MKSKKMNEILLYKFCEEIYYHCYVALEIHKSMVEFYNSMANPYNKKSLYNLDSNVFLRYSIEAILIHSAGVSKILFPPTKNKDRGEEIRFFLDILESSSLSNRDLRNSFEHTDERLDKFLDILDDAISNVSIIEKEINSLLSYGSSSFGHSQNGFSAKWFTREITIEEGRELLSELRKLKDTIESKYSAIKSTFNSRHA